MTRIFLSISFIITTGIFSSICGQQITREMISDANVKSVKLHRAEWNLSYPVIKLGSDDEMVLHFDILDDEVETYYYTFIHCDKDWNVSDIYQTDYLDGFAENPVDNWALSFNTTVNYVHYWIRFPNQNINFRYSGNYIIKIFPFGEADKPIIVKRFMVSEKRANIEVQPQRPKLTEFYDTHQQVDLSVKYPGMDIRDPFRTMFVSILQNGRWENARQNLKADFIGNNELIINDLSGKNIFEGLSEFRYFDIKSLRYQTEYIRSIDYRLGSYHVYLLPSDNRSYRQYFYWQDQNGKYYTAVQEGRDNETESDYVYVYFTLPADFPVREGEVYIYGDLTGWMLSSDNRMTYNYEDHAYECTLLLKQGWYNYLYAVAGKDSRISFEQFEGNHFETENDYLILVYLREPMERYDRLIGNVVSNTLNK
ncbi:MAG TPA: DUF5103 domain-containing protein [Bacteroidales bacterium]|nr:DUF5103 domain-containing protein [Bacteroidales bacterium]